MGHIRIGPSKIKRSANDRALPFVYVHRTPEAWHRAAYGGGPPPIGKKDCAWLGELLRAASAADSRLSAWESGFVEQFAERYARWGERVYVSPRQRAALHKIEVKLTR